jgi:hypothetical protein
MPRIEMRDAFGVMYRIDTRSQETLQRWFDELLPALYPSDANPALGDPYITAVYPLDYDGTGFDWPADSRYMASAFTIPRDPKRALAELDRRAGWIKLQEGKPWDGSYR